MKTKYTRILNRWQGWSLADCDCKYCLFYGGKRHGKAKCLADDCVCKEEIEAAARRERMNNGSKDKPRNP